MDNLSQEFEVGRLSQGNGALDRILVVPIARPPLLCSIYTTLNAI